MSEIKMDIKDLFELLTRYYWENIQEMDSLSSLTGESKWFDSLIHLKDYAYERNISGAASFYRNIASRVLECLKERSNWRYNLEKKIWDEFKNECQKENRKPNIKVNPLRPSRGNKVSLVKFVWDISDKGNETVASWSFRLLSENKIKEAHERLKTIWGIGDKIASFYLRDIFWLGHKLKPETSKLEANDLHLLQPIDIWVERAARALGVKQNSTTSIAKSISSFERDNGLAPGGGNIGFWVLGSNYLESEDDFCDVIRAISQRSRNYSKKALDIATEFETFYGQFGTILKNILRTY